MKSACPSRVAVAWSQGRWLVLFAALLSCVAPRFVVAQEDDLSLREEQAIKQAVEHVAPSVVRIETVGGLERVGKILVGTGPTTGLIVSKDGYIISSAFNFVQQPTSVLVGLSDGTRTPAKIVARDHNRMLVLLKVEAGEVLPVPQIVPQSEIQIGQWAVAVGRTFEGDQPNLSVGIVSAVRRIWGKAIQTDAKISPSNYGGPLIDIQGRVLGVLVPLAPTQGSAVAGVEWYDSGIGFAVPMEHIQKILPRFRAGKDLHSGLLGISMKPGNQFADPAVIGACRANSPAYKAGLKVGDTIVAIDGQEIVRQSQVKEQISPMYAGDTVKVAVLRGKERLERDVTLIEKLEPYQFPFLGLLPQRAVPKADGLVVRMVYPKSPADQAGVKAGDKLLSLAGQPIPGYDALLEQVAGFEPKQKVALVVQRGDQELSLELALSTLPEAVPDSLPPAHSERPMFMGERPNVGVVHLKVAEFPNDCLGYVPEAYDPDVPCGVLIALSPDGTADEQELLARWKSLCDAHDLILLAPQSVEPKDPKAKRNWDASKDGQFIGKVLEQLKSTYQVDRTRLVAQGYQGGGALAAVLVGSLRTQLRGVVVVDAAPGGAAPENEPIYRLAYYVAKASKAGTAAATTAAVKRLRDAQFPVTEVDLGEKSRDLNDDERANLVRWIDTLDRL